MTDDQLLRRCAWLYSIMFRRYCDGQVAIFVAPQSRAEAGVGWVAAKPIGSLHPLVRCFIWGARPPLVALHGALDKLEDAVSTQAFRNLLHDPMAFARKRPA